LKEIADYLDLTVTARLVEKHFLSGPRGLRESMKITAEAPEKPGR